MNVSIALCTYNGQKYLREQLDSYTSQTYPVSELVVCDDVSTDDTITILEAYAQTAPFAVHIHKNEVSLGVRHNFEKAIGLCTSDLIFLSDQDDIWPKEKTAEFVSAAQAQPGMLGFFSDAWLLLEGGAVAPQTLWRTIGLTEQAAATLSAQDLCAFLLGRFNLVYGSMTAIRRIALPYILPFQMGDTGLWHDQWTALSLAVINKFTFIDKPLLYYRQHAGQEVGLHLLASYLKENQLIIDLSGSSLPGNRARLQMIQYWMALKRTKEYADILPALQQRQGEFERLLKEGRDTFLQSESFLRRKLRILKWAREKRFGIKYADLFRI